MRLILAAIVDADSQLNQWLKATETWAQGAFPGGGRGVLHSHQYQRATKLDALLEFVRQKHFANVLTDADVERITLAAGLGNPALYTPPASEALAAAGRMMRAIVELHPELTEEAAKFQSVRSL